MHEILIEEKVLARNNELASANRAALKSRGIFSINMVSAPGAGKTSLIEALAPFLKGRLNTVVIEGDLQTDLDSRRVARSGIPAKQITTGKACHLDAHAVGHALDWVFGNPGVRLLIIENVGNMVCPAEYDLGEDMMATVLSTAEGDDKPLKYPAIFSASDILVINKTDLAPLTDFDIKKARSNALKINPRLLIFETSCRTGDGIEALSDHIAGLGLSGRD